MVWDTLWINFGMDTHLKGLKPVFNFMEDKLYVGTAVTAKWVSTNREPVNLVQKRYVETGRSWIDHNLAAIDFSKPGDIIVIDGEGYKDVALMGDNMVMLAKRNGVSAAVLDGGIRDIAKIRKMRFPIFASGITPKASIGFIETVGFNVPVTCGGVQVKPGDIIVGDEDGVVSVPRELSKKVLELCMRTLEKEEISKKAIKDVRYALESYPAGRPEILENLKKRDI